MKLPIVLAALALVLGCERTTGTLADEQLARAEREGITHRAVDQWFRYTHGIGTAREGWEDRRVSIVVTRESVLIHDGDQELFLVTPRSTGRYEVHRDKDRVSIGGGRGQSRKSWSFRPADDADAWTKGIRAVIATTAGAGEDERDAR